MDQKLLKELGFMSGASIEASEAARKAGLDNRGCQQDKGIMIGIRNLKRTLSGLLEESSA